SDEWTDDTYPALLLVFPDSRVEAKAQAYIEKLRDDAYIEDGDLKFLTTTMKALLESANTDVWSGSSSEVPSSLRMGV
ncbi:MAG TPA: hypothetical protein PKD15_05260, partial [Candidatus Saccharibacteria bacterium]|nr:hypothetical protein [Candidatus Saccharibacteria bacterium]